MWRTPIKLDRMFLGIFLGVDFRKNEKSWPKVDYISALGYTHQFMNMLKAYLDGQIVSDGIFLIFIQLVLQGSFYTLL